MEKLSFSQQELQILLAIMNIAVQSGKLQLGDIINMTPIVIKIDAQIKKPKAEKPVLTDGTNSN